MNRPVRNALSALGVVLASLVAAGSRVESGPTRLIAAAISVDGAVVLRGSTSDDGHPDVDTVWDYQRGDLAYAPTDEFAALGVPVDAREWTLTAPERPEITGRQPRLELDVAYGGTVRTRELRLVRVPRTARGAEWRVHVDELERLFGYRTITRTEAARLESPKRTK